MPGAEAGGGTARCCSRGSEVQFRKRKVSAAVWYHDEPLVKPPELYTQKCTNVAEMMNLGYVIFSTQIKKIKKKKSHVSSQGNEPT